MKPQKAVKDSLTTHTPLPWAVFEGTSLYPDALPYYVGKSQDGKMTPFQTAGTRAKANAAFIVRAVNCHEELLEACKRALAERIGQPSRVISDDGINVLRQAISKAEGR